VAAGDALKKDSMIGDAAQIVVSAEAAECFVHPHGERPQGRKGLEFVTVKYQPWMNVYQHTHFSRLFDAGRQQETHVCLFHRRSISLMGLHIGPLPACEVLDAASSHVKSIVYRCDDILVVRLVGKSPVSHL
jgi:hypothetical protein